MEIIKTLLRRISDELHDAMFYATKAVKIKDGNPELARTFFELSEQELQHAESLQGAANAELTVLERVGYEHLSDIKAVLSYESEVNLDTKHDITLWHDMYRR